MSTNFQVNKVVSLDTVDYVFVGNNDVTSSKIPVEAISFSNFVGLISLSDIVTPSATISDPAGGATVDTQARTAINSILDLLQAQGLMS